MEVRSTKNYDLFKYLPENRAIHKSHVKKLEDSIRQQNLLSVNPIVLDKNMFILDGQHRLEACKNMDIPVFYTVLSEDCDHTSLFLLQQSKLWTKQRCYLTCPTFGRRCTSCPSLTIPTSSSTLRPTTTNAIST